MSNNPRIVFGKSGWTCVCQECGAESPGGRTPQEARSRAWKLGWGLADGQNDNGTWWHYVACPECDRSHPLIKDS